MGMINFKKVKYTQVEATGEYVFVNLSEIGAQLPKRGIVCFADKGVAYLLEAKVRNTDLHSILKALLKVLLMDMRELRILNQNEDVIKSENLQKAGKLSGILNCHTFGVTNKYGELMQSSVVGLSCNSTLKEIQFAAKKQHPIYKLVVEQGLDWSDTNVQDAMNSWIGATIAKADYVKRVDKGIAEVAEHNNQAVPESEDMSDVTNEVVALIGATESVVNEQSADNGEYVEFEEFTGEVVA